MAYGRDVNIFPWRGVGGVAALGGALILSLSASAAPQTAVPHQADLPGLLKATSSASRPMNLLLTQSELRSVISAYEDRTGEILTAPIDDEEILVTAPGERVPMRDVGQDAWGGIAAPFWALTHPKDAWRIFVPIPARSLPANEHPAPDPR
jgi:hypothetical protein